MGTFTPKCATGHMHIHSQVYNRLAPVRTDKLAYIYSNQKVVAADACNDKLKMYVSDNEWCALFSIIACTVLCSRMCARSSCICAQAQQHSLAHRMLLHASSLSVARRRNAILKHSSPVLWSGKGKIWSGGTLARARPAALGGAGRRALVSAPQRPCQPCRYPAPPAPAVPLAGPPDRPCRSKSSSSSGAATAATATAAAARAAYP